MKILEGFERFSLGEGDKVLVHYWYNGMVCPTQIIKTKGRKFLISYDIEESMIQNAPSEWVKKEDIIDKLR